ncbi:exocyst complex component SEC10a-like [Phaseolus vulgaris]|uniref:exocyst complex component SEC10a-like n=1 Tax=Phaseolus vulgaris TaxID=3885 RepID=UPI0035CAE308
MAVLIWRLLITATNFSIILCLCLVVKLEEAEADDGEPNGHIRVSSDAAKYSSQAVASPLFPGVEKLLSLFKDSCKELLELRKEIDGRLYNLKKDVSVQDSKHRKTLSEYLMEFNSSPCDLVELSPLFSDDSRVAEVASVAQKLRHLLKKILEDMEYLFHQLWEM